jgi:mannose-6-phosphate isomerase-like protein (cupin superfamily)
MSVTQRYKKAQSQDGVRGAIGGFLWKADEIIKNETLPKDDMIKFVYLAEGTNLTTNIALGRDLVPLHVHKFHDELIHVIQGSGKLRIGESTYRFEPGCIMYIPQDTVHGGALDEEIKWLSVYTPRFDIRNPDRIFVDENGTPISD